MELHERIRKAREQAGFETAADACRRFGWQLDTYRSHENGNRGVRLPTIKAYAKAFRVPEQWIISGENSTLSREAVSAIDVSAIPVVCLQELPALRDQARSLIMQKEAGQPCVYVPKSTASPDDFAVEVTDNSMVDASAQKLALWPGDRAHVSPSSAIRPGRLALAHCPVTREACVRRVRDAGGGTLIFAPYNDDYAAFSLPADSPHIFGVVVGIYRSLG